jgi:hypothetical protein
VADLAARDLKFRVLSCRNLEFDGRSSSTRMWYILNLFVSAQWVYRLESVGDFMSNRKYFEVLVNETKNCKNK